MEWGPEVFKARQTNRLILLDSGIVVPLVPRDGRVTYEDPKLLKLSTTSMCQSDRSRSAKRGVDADSQRSPALVTGKWGLASNRRPDAKGTTALQKHLLTAAGLTANTRINRTGGIP